MLTYSLWLLEGFGFIKMLQSLTVNCYPLSKDTVIIIIITIIIIIIIIIIVVVIIIIIIK